MDPYKVLGVTPQSTDDEIKRAYRDLARKYHPDTYINNPLADLAEARMKEINEAYDMLSNRNKSGGAHGSSGGYQSYTGGQRSSGSAQYAQVRSAINAGNLSLAQELLQRMTNHDAEWHYLMGIIYMRKGWHDEALRSMTAACNMDPSNAEYRAALEQLRMGNGYGGYRPMNGGVTDCNSFCLQSLCLTCLCNSCCMGC